MIMPNYPADGDNKKPVREQLRTDLNNRKSIYYTCFNIALKITGNWNDAEDLTMSAYETAIKNAEKYDRFHSIKTWMGIMVRNLSVTHLRSTARRTRLCSGYVQNLPNQSQKSPVDLLIEEEERGIIEQELSRLPPKEKAVFVLKHLGGRTHKEIEELTGYERDTVRSRIGSAKEILMGRRRLQELVA